MRKKSHISLASYLLNSMNMEDLTNHKKAFYIGSILPDCVPSFLTRKHNIDQTFDILLDEIKKITIDYDMNKGITRYYSRHLGVITHYVADYFTFPHNQVFEGSLKDHCRYESELKFALKDYIKSDEAKLERDSMIRHCSVDEIARIIKEMHEEYLRIVKVIKNDCKYIVELCHMVVDAILKIFEIAFHSNELEPVKIG